MSRKFKRMGPRPAAPAYLKMGLDRWECGQHGWLTDCLKGATAVWCPCGRMGKLTVEGPERVEANG